MLNAPLRYLIVDDEEIDRIAVENEAKKFPFLQRIASCSHPVEAFEMIDRFHPDIIFLDIEMPDMSGMDLMKTINKAGMLPVFITSHPEFAIESYELDAFDYLLKPISAERFARCAHRLIDFCQMRTKAFAFDGEQESGFIMIKQGHDKHKLSIYDIMYLEAMKDYTRIKTAANQYLVLTTLSGIMEKLPADLFVRIHRSYAVNCKKVDIVEKSKVSIRGQVIPVGKLYKNALKPFFT